MKCKRCGGAAMPETVIKLRRGVFGLHETRSQGAYCAACGIGWAVDSVLPAAPRPTPRFAWLSDFRPIGRVFGMARPERVRAGGSAAYDPLSLAG